MKTAIERAKIPKLIYTQWGGSPAEFMTEFSNGIFSIITEDIPHKNKSLTALAVDMFKVDGINFGDLKLQYEGDEYKREDYSWGYRDLFEQMEKGFTEASLPVDVCKTLFTTAENFPKA